MKKILLYSLFIFTANTTLYAQVDDVQNSLKVKTADSMRGWKIGGLQSINFNQSAFSNWAAGGLNSMGINAVVSLYANKKGPKFAWDNTLDLGYGLVKQGENSSFIKTDDKIDFSSKYGKQASEFWYYAVLANFRTQFYKGFKLPNDSVPISKFLSPAYLLTAIGMDYKPSPEFTMFIAPITAKTTIVSDQTLANQGAFGIEPATLDSNGNVLVPAKNYRYEFGGYLRIAYRKDDILPNVGVSTKIDFFSNYLDKPQNIDVNWEALLNFKVNKYISANISTQLIYDDDINIKVDKNKDGIIEAEGPRIQFKEILGIGLSYNFEK